MNVHKYQIRVRYEETDQMGIVYYANYLVWFEVARTEYLRSKGLCYRGIEKQGYYLPVVESYCKYISALSYDDIVDIHSYIDKISRSSFCFYYKLYCDKRLVAEGNTKHVLVNSEMKPVSIPEDLKSKLLV